MTNKTLNKIILSATTAMFLTACGGGGGGTPSAAEIAAAKIQAYAEDNSNPVPTVVDYTAVGVTSITDANLAAMNQLVDSKTGDEVDELSELTSLAGEVDVTAPVITLLGSPTVSIVAGTTYTDAGATATDTKDGSLTVTVGGDTVSTTTPGTYVIRYNVSDDAGNAATEVTRTVTVTEAEVVDTTPPVITRLGDNPVTILVNTPYTDAGATASDDVDGNITAEIHATSIDVNRSEEQVIIYTVSDEAGNPAIPVTRTVHVLATQFVVNSDTNEVKDILRGLTWKNELKTKSECTGDFHIPTVEQAQTIIDYSKNYKDEPAPALLVDGFDSALTGNAATSNGDINITRGVVHSTIGATSTICVKGTWKPADDNLTRDNDKNIVKDNNTQLVWSDDIFKWDEDENTTLFEKDGSNTLVVFEDANTSCHDAGMRLPTLVELDTIYNRTENNISSGFKYVIPAKYWSDTPIIGETTPYNWTVSFNDDATNILAGQIWGVQLDSSNPDNTAYYRCVK